MIVMPMESWIRITIVNSDVDSESFLAKEVWHSSRPPAGNAHRWAVEELIKDRELRFCHINLSASINHR